MKFLILAWLPALLFALLVVAVAPQKAFVVTFPDATPDSVIDRAKDSIRSAGGLITHEYKLIK